MKKNLWILALVLAAGLLAAVLASTDPVPTESASGSDISSSTVVFSEICAQNESVIPDNDGKYRDYIELYNSGAPVCLKGFAFYDGKTRSEPIGDITLETGEYRVFFISRSLTGFALSASGGDTVQLLDPGGSPVAQLKTAGLNADEVMLLQDGVYSNSYDASPGFSNDPQGRSLFVTGTRVQTLPLVISEVLAGNVSALPDEKGAFCDVVELHNLSAQPIALDRYFLSDDEGDRFCFRLPQGTLEPGEFLLIYCDGENYISEEGVIHANFGLSYGEALVLTAHTGEFVSVPVALPGDDVSLFREADGSYTAGRPSLGYENTVSGMDAMARSRIDPEAPLAISEVLLSSAGAPHNGAFCDVVEIANISRETVSTAGWYLSDGGDPYAFPLPGQTLAPGERIVVSCGVYTTGFSLSEGETLRLMAPDRRFAQPVLCTEPEAGKSLSLLGAGTDHSYAFGAITLGFPNEEAFHSMYLATQLPKDLRISEVMSSNGSWLKGPYGTTCDWLELYNPTSEALRLSDYCITDSKGNLHKYPLPDRMLEPGECCVILLSDDTTNLRKDYPVLPMPLAVDGETLYLTKDGQITDWLQLPPIPHDMSYGRAPGSALCTLLKTPTPGGENSGKTAMTPSPVALTEQGCYDDVEYVDVVLEGQGDIYYTTDCNTPTLHSNRYTGPIRLTKTTVLRVMCHKEGMLPSQTLDLTYLINEYDHLPVISLVTEPDNLWSEWRGIYVTGPGAGEEVPYYGANYWMGWEKSASISLFEVDGGGFTANCGLKIFGNYSRIRDKKSLSCMFRSQYGYSQLEYPLFGEAGLDTYESFILRSGGQDSTDSRIRDELVTSLVGDYTDVPVQDYRPVVVYLDGRYWGLHYIREKLTEHYLAGHYNADAEDLAVIYPSDGRDPDYWDLIDYIRSHDMSVDAHYDYVCTRMDVDNYIDYIIAQMWIVNDDLPGNVKFFRTPEGKWTWILFDADISFIDSSVDMISYLFRGPEDPEKDIVERVFATRLIENPRFREQFLTRLAWQMNNLWSEEVVQGRIDDLVAQIGPDMEKECRRWNDSVKSWENQLEVLRQFAASRNRYMLEHIRDYFDLTDEQLRGYGFAV